MYGFSLKYENRKNNNSDDQINICWVYHTCKVTTNLTHSGGVPRCSYICVIV